VLLRYKGEHFLLSAAHVIKKPDVSLYLGTETSWKELPHPYHYTVPSASRDGPTADIFDVGFIHLPRQLAQELDGCVFLQETDVDLAEQPLYAEGSRSLYVALGWPQNRFKFDWREKKTKPDNLGYFGPAAPIDCYRRLDLDPTSHLLLSFDQESVVNPSGAVGLAPKLHGMSGGGIWRVNSFATRDVGADKLVAVTISREPAVGCIVGTRLQPLFRAMTSRLELGPAASSP